MKSRGSALLELASPSVVRINGRLAHESFLMNGRTILVVDDDPGFLAMCRELLETSGYAVVTASSGTAAIRILDTSPEVDLVVVDIFMPERDGFEVIAFVRGRHPRPSVVAMSGGGTLGASGKDVLDQARLLGASAVLRKPFTHGDLIAAIAQAEGRTSPR